VDLPPQGHILGGGGLDLVVEGGFKEGAVDFEQAPRAQDLHGRGPAYDLGYPSVITPRALDGAERAEGEMLIVVNDQVGLQEHTEVVSSYLESKLVQELVWDLSLEVRFELEIFTLFPVEIDHILNLIRLPL